LTSQEYWVTQNQKRLLGVVAVAVVVEDMKEVLEERVEKRVEEGNVVVKVEEWVEERVASERRTLAR
jgi:hypothetical protein